MSRRVRIAIAKISGRVRSRRIRPSAVIVLALLTLPLIAHAQAAGSPFDTGFTALQNLFTGTIAKVASLIAIVIGGYGFAHGEPGAKKTSVLDAIRQGAEAHGYAVEGFAPTSRAAQQLRDSGISAGTLQGFLAQGGREEFSGDPTRKHLYFTS
jgi:type IV secretory pathway VirB2 component (pilin)